MPVVSYVVVGVVLVAAFQILVAGIHNLDSITVMNTCT